MKIEILGTPTPNIKPRTTRNFIGVYQPIGQWYYAILQEFTKLTKLEGFEKLDGPLYLNCKFYFQRPKKHYKTNGELNPKYATFWHTSKPDTDNLLKGLKDAITKSGYIFDDAQICHETSLKIYSETPKTIITLEKITENYND
jgi:Holliday junction resolvase RusA-like endonuclease